MTFSHVDPTTPAGRLLAHTAAVAERHGVTLDLAPAKHVFQMGDSSMPCSGYFLDRPTPTLAVALDKPTIDWVLIAAHEGSHMDQWVEQVPAWTDLFEHGEEASLVLDRWLAGEVEFEPAVLDRLIDTIQACELDAERRTLDKLVAFGLTEVDPTEYAQRSNAYVHFYSWVKKHRAWSPEGRPPYQVDSLWAQAPTAFADVAGPCPPALMAAFEAEYGPAPTTKASFTP